MKRKISLLWFVCALVMLFPEEAFAQTVPEMSISLGQYALPPVLMVILGLIYKISPILIEDRYKSVIAVCAGMVLGFIALFYAGGPYTAKLLIDYILYGFMAGASAVGLYEIQRSAINPRN